MNNPIHQAIRQTHLAIRKQLSTERQASLSHLICHRIRGLHAYRYAQRIALYHAINGEVDLEHIWRTAPLHGKYCYFPTVNKDGTLLFLPATPASQFYENEYGILEPQIEHHHAISPSELDLILMPLVAFDEFGTRIGMGKGYYDKTLSTARPPLLVGVAYDFQRYPFIEPQPWDVPLDAIITDQTIYWRKT